MKLYASLMLDTKDHCVAHIVCHAQLAHVMASSIDTLEKRPNTRPRGHVLVNRIENQELDREQSAIFPSSLWLCVPLTSIRFDLFL